MLSGQVFFCVYPSKATGGLEIGTCTILNSVNKRKVKRYWLNPPYFHFFNKAEHCKHYTELHRWGMELYGNSGAHFGKPLGRHGFSKVDKRCCFPSTAPNSPILPMRDGRGCVGSPLTDQSAHFHVCRYSWPPTAVFRAVELLLADLSHIAAVSHLRSQYFWKFSFSSPPKCFLL